MRMLEEEGFAWENYIDIFDGGPTMTARTDQIRTVREARDAAVVAVDDFEGIGATKRLLTHGRLADFRAAYGWAAEHDGGIAIDPAAAAALGVREGDTVSHVARES
jgi:arginine N-succinyltransferase